MSTKKKDTVKKDKQKDKAWYREHLDKRNAERRKLYAKDAKYRAACIQASRARYRDTCGIAVDDCRYKLDKLETFGTERFVHLSGSVKKLLTFDMTELSKVIGYSMAQLYRWKGDGRLPLPSIKLVYAQAPKGRFMCTYVYSLPEVEAIVRVLGEHRQVVKYYRLSHTQTIKKLFSEVKKAAKKVG